MSWERLDSQLAKFSLDLEKFVRLSRDDALHVATRLSLEFQAHSDILRKQLLERSPVSLKSRLHELTAFQLFTEIVSDTNSPIFNRANNLYQNYICFVYLPESLFTILRKSMPPDSISRRCARFLTDNPVRAFRNAIAHGNWEYGEDFTKMNYWAKKDEKAEILVENMKKYSVNQKEIDFWHSLAKVVGYSLIQTLSEIRPAGFSPPQPQ